MTITLTREQVREMTPPARILRDLRDNLPDWNATAYTAAEMAARGVPHRTIVWAFLRPEVLGSSFGEVVCQIAEAALPAFRASRPGDTRPRAAIEAARRCFAEPTEENRDLSDRAAVQAWAASRAAADAAGVAGAEAAWSAAETSGADAAGAEAEWAAWLAAWAAKAAVDAGCPPATVLSIIEGAGQ